MIAVEAGDLRYNMYVVPTECTDHTEAYGIKVSNPQNGLRFARQESTEMIASAAIDSEPYLTSATLHKQSILCLLSYDAQRLYALWIPKP